MRPSPDWDKQPRNEPVKATFELFHSWAGDVGKPIKKIRPKLGQWPRPKSQPPKSPRFKLKAVRGARRRVLLQEDDEVTGAYPPQTKEWIDCPADDSDDSDMYQYPWYWSMDRRMSVNFKPEDEDAEFFYVCHVALDAEMNSFPILPLVYKYIEKGIKKRNPQTWVQWMKTHKAMLATHVLWIYLTVGPWIYNIFWPLPEFTWVEPGWWVWPAPDTTYVYSSLPFHFWPPHPKGQVGWSAKALTAYGIFFTLHLFVFYAKWYWYPD